MAVQDGEAVNAAVTNAAFVSRTENSSIGGILAMNNGSSEAITNAQLSINRSRRVERALQVIINNGRIENLDNISEQYIPLVSTGGEVTLNPSFPILGIEEDPFGSQQITLVGTSDTDYVRLQSSDSLQGMMLNGDLLLKRFTMITLVYIDTLQRWVEKCRNI